MTHHIAGIVQQHFLTFMMMLVHIKDSSNLLGLGLGLGSFCLFVNTRLLLRSGKRSRNMSRQSDSLDTNKQFQGFRHERCRPSGGGLVLSTTSYRVLRCYW